MTGNVRVEWNELRSAAVSKSTELFLIIAERSNGHWNFSERSSWDVVWTSIQATPSLINRAEQERCAKGLS